MQSGSWRDQIFEQQNQHSHYTRPPGVGSVVDAKESALERAAEWRIFSVKGLFEYACCCTR